MTSHLFDRICADARSHCRAEHFNHDVLHRLQRVRIAEARDWLAAVDSPDTKSHWKPASAALSPQPMPSKF
ncbi:hypothetical protein BIWAKO_06115 [Bosea sp. BIWAKO-01]|nr:hypothetical protein BIWAKO_06115 [Bosea sp. BIWAKO-01]